MRAADGNFRGEKCVNYFNYLNVEIQFLNTYYFGCLPVLAAIFKGQV